MSYSLPLSHITYGLDRRQQGHIAAATTCAPLPPSTDSSAARPPGNSNCWAKGGALRAPPLCYRPRPSVGPLERVPAGLRRPRSLLRGRPRPGRPPPPPCFTRRKSCRRRGRWAPSGSRAGASAGSSAPRSSTAACRRPWVRLPRVPADCQRRGSARGQPGRRRPPARRPRRAAAAARCKCPPHPSLPPARRLDHQPGGAAGAAPVGPAAAGPGAPVPAQAAAAGGGCGAGAARPGPGACAPFPGAGASRGRRMVQLQGCVESCMMGSSYVPVFLPARQPPAKLLRRARHAPVSLRPTLPTCSSLPAERGRRRRHAGGPA